MPTWRSHVSRFSAGTSAGKEMEDAPDGPPEEAIFFLSQPDARRLNVFSIPWLEAFFWNRNQLVGSFKCVFFSSMHCLLGVTV